MIMLTCEHAACQIILQLPTEKSTCSEGAVAPHTCIPHPSHDPGCWAADDDTCGGFKWPKLFEEAPAVPQTISEGGNSDLRRAQVLNSFAGEQWTDSKSHVPLCIFGFPSIEHTQALKEHLSTSAFLPSLVADGKEAEQRGSKAQNSQRAMGLESADKSESRRYLKDHYIGKHVDATHTTIHKVVCTYSETKSCFFAADYVTALSWWSWVYSSTLYTVSCTLRGQRWLVSWSA